MMEQFEDKGFTKIIHKRKRKSKNNSGYDLGPLSSINHFHLPVNQFDLKSQIRRILEAKRQLVTKDVYQSTLALLTEALSHLSNPKIGKIVCYGLGRVSEQTVPRYQLALLLCLKDLFQTQIQASDPIFNLNDVVTLEHFEVTVETMNNEAKFTVNDVDTVLFYLPHCPKQLMNNLLWCNWGLQLSKCVIIGNSINRVIEDNPKRILSKSAGYISKICPYVMEFGIVNSGCLYEVFNDTGIHIFPMVKLSLLPEDFWRDNKEPYYSDSDLEFIREGLQNKLSVS